MLEHYVVLKPHPGREQQLTEALRELAAGIGGGVTGLRHLTWGENTNASGLARGYTHGCLGRFDTARAFDAYWVHPAHQLFMSRLDEICSERFAMDYATDPAPPGESQDRT
ncbi:Dabb family protein [Streptomyces sp. SID10853]|uniref:Dabb family protein n=1 Tax=Streptomyces sp. SID10853 TaxID=2706028 RepID=UPI0013C0FE65|nr:Dabb family protein [Streptomyces sp. SID10853]NDZ78631.1 Dabb family protein [Streptomyces sp. SID10853]